MNDIEVTHDAWGRSVVKVLVEETKLTKWEALKEAAKVIQREVMRHESRPS